MSFLSGAMNGASIGSTAGAADAGGCTGILGRVGALGAGASEAEVSKTLPSKTSRHAPL